MALTLSEVELVECSSCRLLKATVDGHGPMLKALKLF